MKFKPYDQHQQMMLPPNVVELIPENHFVRVLDEVIEQLDFTELYTSYSEEGQPAYHPKLLVKVFLYGYATGVRSSRKLAQKLECDVFFMYLAGMQRPDFRTLSDFRKEKYLYLQDYFTQVLLLCKQLGLTSLGHVAFDGTKLKASAAKSRTKDREDLVEMERKLREKVHQMLVESETTDEQEDRTYGERKRGDEVPPALAKRQKLLSTIQKAKQQLEEHTKLKRVNLTDPDARFMKTPTGAVDICYNGQIAVDSDHQIIVAADVTEQEHDHQQFIPMYEQVVSTLAKEPKQSSADSGFYSGNTYLYLEQKNIDAYIPDCKFTAEADEKGEEYIPPFDRRKFQYQAIDDTYRCPAGEQLRFLRNSVRNNIRFKVYQGTTCPVCQFREHCISKEVAKYRQIQIYENDAFKVNMRRKLHSEEGQHRYLKRMSTVEPVIAQLKQVLDFRKFLLRGKEKIKTEFRLLCTAYNLKKLATIYTSVCLT
jgi:transposase